MDERQLLIWFDRIDRFIKIDNEIRYLALLKHNETYGRIRYLISKKSDITNGINYNVNFIN